LEAQRQACEQLRNELKSQEEKTLNTKADNRMMELRLKTAEEQVGELCA
jgi:hypothetical protein